MLRPIAIATAVGILSLGQAACTQAGPDSQKRVVDTGLASQSQPGAAGECERLGVRLVISSRKVHSDGAIHYEFGEVEDTTCTADKVWQATR